MSNPDLELAKFLDRESNTGYNQNILPKTIRGHSVATLTTLSVSDKGRLKQEQ